MPAFNQFGQPSNSDISQMAGQTGQRAARTGGSDPFSNTQTPNSSGQQTVSTPTPPASPQAFQSSSYAPNAGQGNSGQQSPSNPLFNGMNPQLVSVFQNAGVNPTGQGTGNTDIAYWNSKIQSDPSNAQYYLNRVQGDLSGNGMDSGGPQTSINNPLSGFMSSLPQTVQGFSQLLGNVSYTPGQLPTQNFATYQPGQVGQYSNINQQPTMNLQNQVLQNVLSNPSLSPDVINQMQGQLHGQAATMLQGQMANARQNYAGLGYSGGGQEAADINNLQMGSASNLLNQYNQLNTTAAEQNYQDRLNASNAATGAMTGQVNNAVNQYNAGLQGQMSQQQLNQLGVQSQNAATQYALQRALEQEGLSQQAANIGIQNRGQNIQTLLGLTGLGQNYDLANANLGLGYSNLGYNYANLQNNMNQQALQAALAGLNG